MALASSGVPRPSRLAALLFLAALPWAAPAAAPDLRDPASAEEALAAALLEKKDDAEREALLLAADFDGNALVRALDREFDARNRAGEAEEAEGAARLMVLVAERFGDPPARTRAHGARGVHLFNTGQYEESITAHERSRTSAETAGDRIGIARARMNAGLALAELGFYDRAQEEYAQAYALADAAGSRAGMAIISSNVGMVHQYRGDDVLALRAYERALSMATAEDKGFERSIPLSNVGQMLNRLGRPDLAIPYFDRAIADAEASSYRRELPAVHLHRGRAEAALGREAAARQWMEKALALARQQGDKRIELSALRALAGRDREEGHRERARQRYEAALQIGRAQRLKRPESSILSALGRLEHDAGRPADALRLAEQAIASARAVGSPDVLSDALTVQAEALAASGRRKEAFAALDEAVALVDDWRLRAATGETSSRFLEDKLAPYHALVRLHVEEGRLAEALFAAERAKARTLVEALHQGGEDVTASMDDGERREERRLEERLSTLNRQLLKEQQRLRENRRRLAALAVELEQARGEYDTFRTRLYAAHPDLRAQRGEAPPLTFEEAAGLAGPDTAVLEYVVAADGVHLFVLTRDAGGMAELAAFKLDATREALERRVRRFREALARRDLDFADEAIALHHLLLAPAQARTGGRRRLVVVPDGVLWELPFQALRGPAGRYVLEEREVTYAPSLTTLRAMQSRRGTAPPGQRVLVVANPRLEGTRPAAGPALMGEALAPLPEAERQAAALRRLYGAGRTRVLLGEAAREEDVKAALAESDVLHFATHGLLDDRRPLYSQLVLATPRDGAREDGLLEAREIVRMRLSASLAVLSACETGRGRIAAGEGVIGLTWAFFVAGVPSTVVSQWKVESASTTDLMVAFHRELRRGAGRGEALRNASLSVRSQPRYRHPFYWAGFIVVGDPGR